jgi:hypothetical protein
VVKMTEQLRRYFAEIGHKGGKAGGSKGGKAAAERMTGEQRRERALKAVQAREAKRPARQDSG